MIPDSLRGGLILCIVNLVVVMTVLGALAWGISLVSVLVRRLEHRPARTGDAGVKDR